LPVQGVRRIFLPEGAPADLPSLIAHLERVGARYSQGAYTVYIPPDELHKTAFWPITTQYPETAGLKVVKNLGSAARSSYTRGQMDIRLQRHLTSHGTLLLSANRLNIADVGPRLFDLVELETRGRTAIWPAYEV